jgi:hypothetical protein
MAFSLRRVSDFQAFLRDRGVVVSCQRKAELAELCQLAKEINLDGLFEDREEVILDKLTDGDVKLPIPSELLSTRVTLTCPHCLFLVFWMCSHIL